MGAGRPICSRVSGRVLGVMWPVAEGSRISKLERRAWRRGGGREV